MKSISTTIMISLCWAAFAMNARGEEKVLDIMKAKSIKIGYMVNGERRFLAINDRRKVKEILDKLSIESTDEGVAVGSRPKGSVNFELPDGKTVNTFFVGSGQLDRADFGQLYLKDTKFYDALNKILTEKEGRKIDVLEDNK